MVLVPLAGRDVLNLSDVSDPGATSQEARRSINPKVNKREQAHDADRIVAVSQDRAKPRQNRRPDHWRRML